jgi:5-methylthioadenosine/S-adenosylhomocysteine deaminase
LGRPVKKPVDLILTNGTVLPLSPDSAPITEGALAVANGWIIALGPKAQIGRSFEARQTIDARGGLIMPGLVNAHTHAPMALFRGLADDLPLKVWLEEYIFPAEARWVDPDFVYWGALLACAEMIRSGTTTLGDGYFFEEQVARAVQQAGMRAILGQGILDFPTPDSPSPAESLEKAEAFLQQNKATSLIRPALFPHSLYTCSPGRLKQCRDLADRYGVPMIIHLAETQVELQEIYQKYGKSPVNHMESLGLLSSSLIAGHCVWLSETEMDLLARRGVKVVHNPESNMKLASGVAPVPELLARGVPVGLGTDGCASNNNQDIFQEMDTAAKLHKVHRLDPTVMPSDVVLQMATLGGAKVLDLDKEIGSLEVGKKADIITLELNRPHLQPIYNFASHLVYSATGADVRDVIIEGRLVMQDRKLLTLDEEKILYKAREWNSKIANSALLSR